jgi:elongation factor G
VHVCDPCLALPRLRSTRGARERINKLLRVSANDFSEVDHCDAGHIAAVVGLKATSTGDTLVHDRAADPALLPGLSVPDAVFFCTVEASSTKDEAALEHALGMLQLEDPSLRVRVDDETGMRVLSGMGELHLEIVGDRLRREFALDVDISGVRVSYKETAAQPAAHTAEFDGMLAGKRQTAAVAVRVAPVEEGAGAGEGETRAFATDFSADSPMAGHSATHVCIC